MQQSRVGNKHCADLTVLFVLSSHAHAVQSAILGFGAFKLLEQRSLVKGFTMEENVIVQTTAVATATMPLAAGVTQEPVHLSATFCTCMKVCHKAMQCNAMLCYAMQCQRVWHLPQSWLEAAAFDKVLA